MQTVKTSTPSKEENSFVLLAGRSNPQLAQQIATLLQKELCEPISIFSDGEVRIKGIPTIRNKHVFIIQPTAPPVNDHLMELIFLLDASKRASAEEITAIIPYFGYSRQDRKEMARVPISASIVAKMIEHAGADRILTLDIHSEQQEGFVRIPWDNLYGSFSLIPALQQMNLTDLVIASPDKGGVPRATGYARLLQAQDIAIVYKERDIAVNNSSKALGMIGNVRGKNVLLVDDMIDTAGTIVNAANYLKDKGAKSVRAAVTHGIFSGHAIQKINASEIEEIITTDSIFQQDEIVNNPKITIVSVAPLLAKAIKRISIGESLGKDLIL